MADEASGGLSAEETRRAAEVVAAWRGNPDEPVVCPRCGLEGLAVIDRSARPYAEWYQLTCAGCTLDATLNIPLGPPVVGGLE